MTDKEAKRAHERARRQRMLAAGMCIRCMGPRCAVLGYTSDRCEACASKARAESVAQARKKRGTSPDRPLVPGKRGPRANLMSTLNRSDEYKPETYKPLRPGNRKPRQTEPHAAPKAPKKHGRYGTLTLEDIRRATSVLPLKPPGK
jgi:hypothetical protein